jgi:uncharacterized membrane protein
MNSFRHWTLPAASALLLLSGRAMGQSYSIQTLPPLPGYPNSFACGMNESGVVVGTSRNGSSWRATRWDNGVASDLGALPGWVGAFPLDVSPDGLTVVGEASTGSTIVPVVWESGVITQLPGPNLSVAGCWQINDAGVIVGRAFGAGEPGDGVACRWEKSGGVWMFTGLPGIPGYSGTYAWGINNAGVVAGAAVNTWSDGRALLWGGPGSPGGFGVFAAAAGVSLSGAFVGDFQATAGGPYHAFYNDGTAYQDLGALAFPNSIALRINSSGTIIGQSYADGVDPTGYPSDNKRGIIWRVGGSMSAVNDLIPPGSGWDVKQLWDLNESGRIVGYGRHNGLWRGLLLIPTCYANCDASTTVPVLNVNDFVCFQQLFAAGASYANCDSSTTPPVLNVNDFVCFQQQFAAGCP